MQKLKMKSSNRIRKRISKLPIDVQVILIDDMQTAFENRLKFWERLVNGRETKKI